MSTETTRGHAFDGIEEFDNRLPNWWLWTFYVTIIFSVVYWLHFHTLGTGDLPRVAFAKAQASAAAELAQNALSGDERPSNETLIQLSRNPDFVKKGKARFMEPGKCVTCHREDGSGLVGPNLTDDRWAYGNTPAEIYDVISEGRLVPDPERGTTGGMQPWKTFGKDFVLEVTAYVMSITGQNLPSIKPPMPYEKQMPKGW